LNDGEVLVGAVGEGYVGIRTERYAVGNRAGAARIREDASVDGKYVGHGEEGGGAGSNLGGESGVPLGNFEAFAKSGVGDVDV
jgi:hypothetical protein